MLEDPCRALSKVAVGGSGPGRSLVRNANTGPTVGRGHSLVRISVKSSWQLEAGGGEVFEVPVGNLDEVPRWVQQSPLKNA
jgi:hypothetical protein